MVPPSQTEPPTGIPRPEQQQQQQPHSMGHHYQAAQVEEQAYWHHEGPQPRTQADQQTQPSQEQQQQQQYQQQQGQEQVTSYYYYDPQSTQDQQQQAYYYYYNNPTPGHHFQIDPRAPADPAAAASYYRYPNSATPSGAPSGLSISTLQTPASTKAGWRYPLLGRRTKSDKGHSQHDESISSIPTAYLGAGGNLSGDGSRLEAFQAGGPVAVAAAAGSEFPVSGNGAAAGEDWQPTGHEKMVMYLLAIVNIIVAMDASIVVTTISTIARDLGADGVSAFWIGTSYLLVNAASQPILTSLSSIFGRPPVLEFCLLAFLVGTVVCATSSSVGQLLAGRCVQGIGGAGIHSLGQVIATDIVPLRHRPKWYSVVTSGWAVGLTTGPIIGGAIVQATTWRWCFWIFLPICVFGLVAVPLTLTLRPKVATLAERLARIDWAGLALFTASATLLLTGVSWGGLQFPWASAQTIVPIVVGVLGFAGSLAYEQRVARYPFMSRSLFRDWGSVIVYFGGLAQGFACYGILYTEPIYFLAVKSFRAVDAGVAMLPVLASIMVGAIVGGRVTSRINNYRWPTIVGWVSATLGVGLFVQFDVGTPPAVWAVCSLLVGFGQGAVLNSQSFAAQTLCLPGEEGDAAAMYSFMRQFGFALGVGISGTTLQNVMALKLRWEGLPVAISEQAQGYIDELYDVPPGALRDGIVAAYRYGLVGCFAVFAAVSGVALVLSVVGLPQRDMNKELSTEHRLDSEAVERRMKRNTVQLGLRDVTPAASEAQKAMNRNSV